MIWKNFFSKYFGLNSIKLQIPFLEAEFAFQEADKHAAWELYVELLTRVTTQQLPVEHGDESSALSSIYSIFGLTRDILKKYGVNCVNFTKVSIIVLNQIIRPFTAKWHKLSLKNAFEDPEQCSLFRHELAEMRLKLQSYARALSEIAGVEDLTEINAQTQ